jgi:hypothetical protein
MKVKEIADEGEQDHGGLKLGMMSQRRRNM